MQRSELEKLSRKELQALAKEHGVKANLSNNDIIAKLLELIVESKEEEVTLTELISAEETAVISGVAATDLLEVEVRAKEVVTVVQNVVPFNVEELNVGDLVEVDLDGVWKKASVKRINKKTVRVYLLDISEELTVKFDDIRASTTKGVVAVEERASVDCAVDTFPAEDKAVTLEKALEVGEELTHSSVEKEIDAEQPNTDAADTNSNETEIESSTMSMESEEASIAYQEEAVAEVAALEVVSTLAEDVTVPLVHIESIPQAPPTPVAAPARVSSIGWSMLDSAVKCTNPASNRRKERRNARRSAMKQLAESMKKESEQTMQDETEEEEKMEVFEKTAQVELPEEVVLEPVSMQVETVQESEIVQMPEVSVVAAVAPTPAPLVASTPAAPAPALTAAAIVFSGAAAASSAKADMLPRMNKAQAMRLGAIQKKIVTSDTLPAESVAFTNKVSRPSMAPAAVAMTPATMHKRNSISTSAPSTANQLHQPGAPFRKPATPLSGRASMLTSGTKRKMSDFGCNSANSTAPDFKRLHTKQFSALKSIAECVDQDKGVGVRMTIAMESAMSNNNTTSTSSTTQNQPFKSKATPQATSAKPTVSSASAVAKQPAVNPFSKVVNNNTPSKKAVASSTPANLPMSHSHQTSRPGSAAVHTGKVHGGSSNIVKSRTVTSFVSGTATAPSSCGHNNLTSFVNNENTASQSVHNSAGPTSFLSKNKGDSAVGAGKHRTVMLTGTNSIRQQHLTML